MSSGCVGVNGALRLEIPLALRELGVVLIDEVKSWARVVARGSGKREPLVFGGAVLSHASPPDDESCSGQNGDRADDLERHEPLPQNQRCEERAHDGLEEHQETGRSRANAADAV